MTADIMSVFGWLETKMAEPRRNGPYVWVTWLTNLLVGQHSCEWASWFRTQHESWSWDKVPKDFNDAAWQLSHTTRINEVRDGLENNGMTVFTENQNWFALRGRTATLGGKADLVAMADSEGGTILDVKTGAPSSAHNVQVMIYMYAIPLALDQYKGWTFDGKVVYNDHEVEVPAASIDDKFVKALAQIIGRVSSTGTPARKVPSELECGRCPITHADCPERQAEDLAHEGETDDF